MANCRPYKVWVAGWQYGGVTDAVDATAGAADQPPLGLEAGLVSLSRHDPRWLVLGETERSTVQKLLGNLAIDVQHVGSTAVAGLDAKPILDIAVALDSASPAGIDEIVKRMVAAGYVYRGDHGPDGGLMFVRGAWERRTVHVHMVPADDPEWAAYVRFRDHLRANPACRDAYQQLKGRLAARYGEDRGAYTEAKAAFIAEILRHADHDPAGIGQLPVE